MYTSCPLCGSIEILYITTIHFGPPIFKADFIFDVKVHCWSCFIITISHNAVLYKALTATEKKSKLPESSGICVCHIFTTHYSIILSVIIILSSFMICIA